LGHQRNHQLNFGGCAGILTGGRAVLFNDSALSSTVNLAANVSPVSVTFSNQTQNYTINSSGGSSLGGAAQSFRKWGGFDQRFAVRCRFADDLVILFHTHPTGFLKKVLEQFV
jgi:hypothetical protein